MVEAITCNHKLVTSLAEPIVTYLLPVLFSKVQACEQESECEQLASELRFLSLKLLTDMLQVLLADEQIYQPHVLQPGQTSAKLEVLIQNCLIPLATKLLTEQEPAPLFGQRLLSCLLDHNIKLTKQLPQQAVLQICDFY